MRQQIPLNGTWDFVADLDPKYHAMHGGFHYPADLLRGILALAQDYSQAEEPGKKEEPV